MLRQPVNRWSRMCHITLRSAVQMILLISFPDILQTCRAAEYVEYPKIYMGSAGSRKRSGDAEACKGTGG